MNALYRGAFPELLLVPTVPVKNMLTTPCEVPPTRGLAKVVIILLGTLELNPIVESWNDDLYKID